MWQIFLTVSTLKRHPFAHGNPVHTAGSVGSRRGCDALATLLVGSG